MFSRLRFIMYLVLALLKVALVNFTLNEYMMMMMLLALQHGVSPSGSIAMLHHLLCSLK